MIYITDTDDYTLTQNPTDADCATLADFMYHDMGITVTLESEYGTYFVTETDADGESFTVPAYSLRSGINKFLDFCGLWAETEDLDVNRLFDMVDEF